MVLSRRYRNSVTCGAKSASTRRAPAESKTTRRLATAALVNSQDMTSSDFPGAFGFPVAPGRSLFSPPTRKARTVWLADAFPVSAGGAHPSGARESPTGFPADHSLRPQWPSSPCPVGFRLHLHDGTNQRAIIAARDCCTDHHPQYRLLLRAFDRLGENRVG